MFRSLVRKRIVAAIVAAGFVIHTTSCGTVLHPERRGQPCGRLDAGIVVLDAVGLLLFFIPGVIAFAVDFTNGTIYLPPEQSADARLPLNSRNLQTVRMSSAALTPQQIETVVRERTGRSVHLEPGTYQATKLNDIKDFSPTTLNLETCFTATQVMFGNNSND